MKLSILIPEYKQQQELLYRCLESIAKQEDVDWNDVEVIVAKDGPDDLNPNNFSFDNIKHMRWIEAPQRLGCGNIRNLCMLMSSGEWFWFIDSDDYLNSMTGIKDILNSIENNAESIMINLTYIWQNPDDSIFKSYNGRIVWGNVIKRSFVLNKDIKFIGSDTNEDICFIDTIFNLSKNITILDPADYGYIYFHTYNKNSIMHTLDNYWKNNASGFFRRLYYVIGKLLENDVKMSPTDAVNYLSILVGIYKEGSSDNEKIRSATKTMIKLGHVEQNKMFINKYYPLTYSKSVVTENEILRLCYLIF